MLPWITRLPPIDYLESPNKSSRRTDVRLVVVHDPEGSYEGTIGWVRNPKAQVSYHVLGNEDFTRATQFVPWSEKAWSCAAFNSYSDNISISGFIGNNWSYAALNRLARAIAFRLHKRGLPAVFLSSPVGIPPAKGWTFHSELGTIGGGHHDPGLTGVKKSFLIMAVKFHLAYGKFRPVWGRD